MRHVAKKQGATYWLSVAAVGLLVGFSIQFAKAWVDPVAAPPGGNVAGPLTTGNGNQTKAGGDISLGGGGDLYAGGVVAAPQLCIGSDCRNAWPVAASGGGIASVGAGNGITVVNGSTAPVVSINAANLGACTAASRVYWNGTSFACGVDAVGVAGVGDNLGNHTATMGLNMAGQPINNSGQVRVTSGGVFGLGGVIIGQHSLNSNSDNWLTLGDENNNTFAPLTGFAANYLSAYAAIYSQNWSQFQSGTVGYAAGFYGSGGYTANAQPQNSNGSIYVNDIFIRSKGRWASECIFP